MKKRLFVQKEAGFLQEINDSKGAGIIDLDGESHWLKADSVAIPHPILLKERDDFRQITVELNFPQKLDQVFRSTWTPSKTHLEAMRVEDFSNRILQQLNYALGLCRRLGYRVRVAAPVVRPRRTVSSWKHDTGSDLSIRKARHGPVT